MKFTVTGSLGHISKPIVEILISAGHNVTVISSDPQKQKAIEELGASAAIGSIEDISFLTKTFTGSDAVYTMVPPNFHATDWKEFIGNIGKNYATAIKNAGIKHVVNLSSIGAHLKDGAGPVSGLYRVEQTFNALENINIVHLRPGSFYTNFYNDAALMKNNGIIAGNYPANTRLVLVDPTDIAKEAAALLQELSFTGKTIHYIVSAEHTAAEATSILGHAIGNPALQWVEATDEAAFSRMTLHGVPAENAKNYVEMGVAIRTGKLFEEYGHQQINASRIPFEQFAKVFAETI